MMRTIGVAARMLFRLIRNPGKNRNQNAFGLNSTIKSGRTLFVSIVRLSLIKKF